MHDGAGFCALVVRENVNDLSLPSHSYKRFSTGGRDERRSDAISNRQILTPTGGNAGARAAGISWDFGKVSSNLNTFWP